MDQTFLLFALVALLAYTVQALSGFGSMLIAITLGMHLYPVSELLPVLVPLDILLSLYIALRHREKVEWMLLARRILPLMGIGLAAGLLLFNYLHGGILKIVYGCFVALVSARELYVALRNVRERRSLSRAEEASWLLAGGLVQGIFASGGPPAVYVAGRIIPDKSRFRSTLAALWVALNLMLAVSYFFTGRLTGFSLTRSAMLLPVVALCILLGERLHREMDERRFRIVVFSLLLCAGISLVLR